ncbi:MAG TPA: hypothetical protein PKE47_08035, partial [Verrucomicrobiota bacterium]|nr:hypothetical protein [Verrucomicrobiota bacterium]
QRWLRFIKVRGRVAGAVTVTRNEILASLNQPGSFMLAFVEFHDNDAEAQRVHYIRRSFRREPGFGVSSVNYDFGELASQIMGMGRKHLKPGDDPITELLRDRTEDDALDQEDERKGI